MSVRIGTIAQQIKLNPAISRYLYLIDSGGGGVTIYDVNSLTKIGLPSFPMGGQSDRDLGGWNSNDSLIVGVDQSSPYVRVWEFPGFNEIYNGVSLGAGVYCATFSPDNSLLLIGHNTSPYLTILDTSDYSDAGITVAGLTSNAIGSIRFSNDGSLVAFAGGKNSDVLINNVSDWSEVSGTPTPTADRGVRWKPDDSEIALLGSRLFVYETTGWTLIYNGSSAPVTSGIDYNTNGNFLAVGYLTSPYLSIFETSGYTAISGPASPPTVAVASVEFNSNGSILAVGLSAAPWLILYDTSDWSVISGLSDPPTGEVDRVIFSNT